MPLKGQHTKSDYMEWEEMLNLCLKLQRDGNYKFALLLFSGCHIGLRIKDLLQIRWQEVLDKTVLVLTETKTQKTRRITIHADLQAKLRELYEIINPKMEDFLFANSEGTSMSIQYINRRIKAICKKYGVKGNYSSHFMRKTLGRRVYQQHNESEKSLLLLSYLFNHASVSTTKIYLGIRDEEIGDLYLSL